MGAGRGFELGGADVILLRLIYLFFVRILMFGRFALNVYLLALSFVTVVLQRIHMKKSSLIFFEK